VVSTKLLLTVARLANASIPDVDLLTRFTENRDEQAFEELVRRHGPLVWSVCRHLLPQHADAEDAFQAVFLALVQSADPGRLGKALPAWLHGVAVRVAAKVKRAAVRRQRRERRASVPEADRSVPDGAWSALLTAVHEEVQRLPDAERTAFVLCDLEGVGQPDAAVRLGWPLGTLTGRLCKARKRLLEKLTRRGIAPAVLALGGLAGSAGTVPAGLVKQVCCFPATGAGVSATVAELARGLVEGITMRMKVLAVTLLVVGVLGLAGRAIVLSRVDAQPQPRADRGRLSQEALPDGPIKESGPLSGMAPPGMGGVASPGWEYKFVDGKNMDREAFEKELAHLGGEGWEFVSSERLRGGNEQLQTVLVFKRARGSHPQKAVTTGRASGTSSTSGADTNSSGGSAATTGRASGTSSTGTNFSVPGSTTGTWSPNIGPPPNSALQIFPLRFATAEAIAPVLQRVFERDGVQITPEPITNKLIIRATQEKIKEVANLLQELDVPTGKR
jgi:RNA polymerase sigma factor (sigma-70 family)